MAVADTTFDVKRERSSVCSAPTAGKTTTFRMLCGLLAPSGGEIEVVGWDLPRGQGEVRAEDPATSPGVLPHHDKLTVEQNLRYFRAKLRLLGSEAHPPASPRRCAATRLSAYRRMPAKSLPWVRKRDLSIACALLHHPKIPLS